MSNNEISSRDGYANFKSTLFNESDRGVALISAAALDFELGELLRGILVDNGRVANEMLAQSRPLATFSARIDMVYLLGWTSPDIRRELHFIRKIRNEFGHTFEDVTFSSPKIKSLCSHLKMSVHPNARERLKFTFSVAYILGELHASKEKASHLPERKSRPVPYRPDDECPQ